MKYALTFIIPANESDSGKTEYGTVYVDAPVSVYQHPRFQHWYTTNGKTELQFLVEALARAGWPLHQMASIDDAKEAALVLRGSHFGGNVFVVDVANDKAVSWKKL